MSPLPRHRVEILGALYVPGVADTKLFDIINVKDLQWAWNSPGGCAEASFSLPWSFETWADINVLEGRGVKIWWDGVLRYYGYIKHVDGVLGRPDSITVQCGGFAEKLNNVYLTESYSDTKVVNILYDLLLKYALTAGVNYHATKLDDEGYEVSQIEFKNVSLAEAINTLVTLARTVTNRLYDWFVDEERYFCYRAPYETANRNYRVGKDIGHLSLAKDNGTIKNVLAITGSPSAGGAPITGTFTDATSVANYGTCMGSLHIPHVNNATELERMGTNLLIRTAFPQDRSVIRLVQDDPDLRARDLIKIHGIGDALTYEFKAMRLQHKLADTGLETEIQGGAIAPNLADIFINRLRTDARSDIGTQAHHRGQALWGEVVGDAVLSGGELSYTGLKGHIAAHVIAGGGRRRETTEVVDVDLVANTTNHIYTAVWRVHYGINSPDPISPLPAGTIYLGYITTDGSGGTGVWDNPTARYVPSNSAISDLSTNKLSRSGGNVTGNVTADVGVTFDGVDLSAHAASATAHHSNANDPTADQKAALAGTSGSPSGTNKYVTNDDSRNADSRAPTGAASGDLAGNYPSPTVARLQHQVEAFDADQGVTSAESGKVFVGTTNDVVFTLPTAAAGLNYTFIVGTTSKRVTITAAAGDTIDGSGTAGNTYSDTLRDSVSVVAVDDTSWVFVSKIGTWTTT